MSRSSNDHATTDFTERLARRTVVVFHAHPDDEAIFTGLTMRALADHGTRVVLVCATSGEAGIACTALAPTESLASRRIQELERASALLGVERLVVLPFCDSGAHQGPYRRGTLGATGAPEIARHLQAVVEQENAEALVHYDPRGIYPHVDHVQVHRAGHQVGQTLGVTTYQATVNAPQVLTGPKHVLHAAADDWSLVGSQEHEVSLTVPSRPGTLLAKMGAMGAYASQIRPEYIDPNTFEQAYGTEWFIRRGAPTVVDSVGIPAQRSAVRPSGARTIEQVFAPEPAVVS